MLQRKKPLTRKKALRAKAPFQARTGLRDKPRREETDDLAATPDDAAERALWPLLTERAGPTFTRQERIGPWRADFACVAARLVILVANADDPARHDWFAAQGWRVLTFAAGDVAYAPERVLDAVAAAFALRVVHTQR